MSGNDRRTFMMKAYKFDGRLHYEQPLEFVAHEKGVLTLKGDKGRKLTHYTREATYTFDKRTLEYFFEDRWYTAALVFDDEGRVVQVYCNIACPAKIDGNTVSFVDLDVDVVVREGLIEVIDLDEFEEHKILYGYESDIIGRVMKTVESLKIDIKEGKYPFNRDILSEA